MILERKAKKTIKIGKNVTIDPSQPAGDWTETGSNWKERIANGRKGASPQTTTTTATTIDAVGILPLPPVVAWAKASEKEFVQQGCLSDDDDDWDKLPCNSNIVDSQPTPDLPRRQNATPMMSPRTSKRTIMSPLVSSLSSLEQVPFNPPGGDIICTIYQLSQSAQSTGGEVAHVFKVRGLPGKVRSATLEDLNVNSKARFVIS